MTGPGPVIKEQDKSIKEKERMLNKTEKSLITIIELSAQ